VAGVTTFGVTTGGTEAGFGGVATAGFAATGDVTAGFSATGGAAGRAGVAASFFPMMAFKTSPGLEMLDKSILVLIPSASRAGRELFVEADCERR
jgi:hypothetical protein